MWLVMIVRRAARNGLQELAVVATVLAMNLGESTLFSAGGMGMLMLVLIGWGVRPIVTQQGGTG